jgi:hypothetical protein
MQETATDYVVHLPEGGWRVSGSRVSLDSVVHGYWEGRSPEAIAFYLRNRDEIDRYLAAQDENWQKLRESSVESHGSLLERLRANSRSTTSQE